MTAEPLSALLLPGGGLPSLRCAVRRDEPIPELEAEGSGIPLDRRDPAVGVALLDTTGSSSGAGSRAPRHDRRRCYARRISSIASSGPWCHHGSSPAPKSGETRRRHVSRPPTAGSRRARVRDGVGWVASWPRWWRSWPNGGDTPNGHPVRRQRTARRTGSDRGASALPTVRASRTRPTPTRVTCRLCPDHHETVETLAVFGPADRR
jgi:hypothetical protein